MIWQLFKLLQIWICQIAYHNLNTLSSVLPRKFSYIFSEICLVLGYLQRITTSYHRLFKKNINICFFKINLTIKSGNALQIAPNYAKLREKVR